MVLFVSLPNIQQSLWRRFPKLALCHNLSAILSLHSVGYRPQTSAQRCTRQNLRFKPMILERTSGFGAETATLSYVDSRENLPTGQTWQQLQERISINLQRNFHGIYLKRNSGRAFQPLPSLAEALRSGRSAFMVTCV